MSKTTEGRRIDPPPVDAVESESGNDRLTRVIQILLAVYLLPALALVLFVGFTMLFVGATMRAVWRVGRLFSNVRGFARQGEPTVSGAWVYRVGSRARVGRRTRQAQAASQAGRLCQPDSDVLN